MKQKLVKYAGIYLIVIIICTFLSRTIWNMNLPKVQAVNLERGNLVYTLNAGGILEVPKTIQVISDYYITLKKIYVNNGDYVEAGQKLFEYDNVEIEEQYQMAWLNTRKMEHQLKVLKQEVNASGISKLMGEGLQIDIDILEYQLEEQKDNLGKISQCVQEPILYAPYSGIIIDCQVMEGNLVSENQLLCGIGQVAQGYGAIFTLNEEDKNLYKKGSKIKVILEDQSVVEGIITSLQSDGIMYVESILPEDLKINYVGTRVKIEDKINIEENVELLDRVCLYETGMNQYYVYVVYESDGIFGKENKVKYTKISVGAIGDHYVYVESGLVTGDKVICSTDRPLADGDRVIIE